MKKKDLKDLRNKSDKEIAKMISEKKFAAKKSQVMAASGKEKNLKVHANLRHEIAQLLTISKEKQILDSMKKEEVKE